MNETVQLTEGSKTKPPHFPSNDGNIPAIDLLATMGLVSLGNHRPFQEALRVYEEAVNAFNIVDEKNSPLAYRAFEIAMQTAYDSLLAIADAYTTARIAEAVYYATTKGGAAANKAV